MKIHFLYGSQSGTAEILCDHLMDSLSDGFDGEVSSLDEVDPTDLDGNTFYVLVSATFGSGQVPDSAQSFLETLEERKPDLSCIRFAIFGLGDRSFGETFNNGSKLLMTQMLACNAQMVGERGLHDASSEELPQNVARPWLKGIVDQLSA
jgi:sulfite reductase alpha subunit-like flavoprotein